MNERIEELADKIWAEEYWTKPNTDKLLPAQLNRFAELIVRECADKVHELIKSDGDEFPLQAVSYRIKQHFGVEE
jgi:hypothetical protein